MSDLSAVAIICSTGRPHILHETLLSLQGLDPGPSLVVLSVASEADVLETSLALPKIEHLVAPRGATKQRNAALRALRSVPDMIVFFDDDIEVAPNHLAAYAQCFRADPNIVLATGMDLMSGVKNIRRDEARQMIERLDLSPKEEAPYQDCRTAYGASMAFRGKLVGRVWFDENLPLYGFMEDYDFTLSCLAFGRCVGADSAKYVHLEPSAGRMSSFRRGYSEIVNPFYIARKHKIGISPRMLFGCLRRTARAIAAIPKGGTAALRGNLKGWTDVLLGRSDPGKVLNM
jgi:GT2 family glycosyltransferase